MYPYILSTQFSYLGKWMTSHQIMSTPSYVFNGLDGETLDLAVVLPTYNERPNIDALIPLLIQALQGLRWEVVFVDDDSPDGTAETIRAYAVVDRRIRLLHRIGRRGLSSACIEGILSTTANYVAVMDADMQHDETLLPRMLQHIRRYALDVVVGTRNSDSGSMGSFPLNRIVLSNIGRAISNFVCRCPVSDPMSGFFMVRRQFFDSVVYRLQGRGFKILVDILASRDGNVSVGELGYTFRSRNAGESKLDASTVVEDFSLIVNKLLGRILPTFFTGRTARKHVVAVDTLDCLQAEGKSSR